MDNDPSTPPPDDEGSTDSTSADPQSPESGGTEETSTTRQDSSDSTPPPEKPAGKSALVTAKEHFGQIRLNESRMKAQTERVVLALRQKRAEAELLERQNKSQEGELERLSREIADLEGLINLLQGGADFAGDEESARILEALLTLVQSSEQNALDIKNLADAELGTED